MDRDEKPDDYDFVRALPERRRNRNNNTCKIGDVNETEEDNHDAGAVKNYEKLQQTTGSRCTKQTYQ